MRTQVLIRNVCLMLMMCSVFLGFVIVFPIVVGYSMVWAAGHCALRCMLEDGATSITLGEFMQNLNISNVEVGG